MASPFFTRPFGALALAALVCAPGFAADSKQSLNQSVETAITQAQAKRLAGDPTAAVKILSQLMLVNADNPTVIAEYGKALVQQGRSREALDFLKRGIQLSPTDWTLFSALGVAYDAASDYPNAKAAYERALQLKPGEAAILNNFALSRALAGDLTEAKSMIAQAAAGSQDSRIARNVAMIDGLIAKAPPVAAAAAAPAPVSKAGEPAAKKSGHTASPVAVASAPPRVLTTAEGNKVVMQAIPADPKAGPVKKATKTAERSPYKPAPKAAKPKSDGIPALRLANDAP